MPVASPHHIATDDARTRVDVDALIALRQRVTHAAFRRVPVTSSTAAGSHASHRRGRGMDYLESRAYQAGDDVRHLDWRLTARSGHLHTKVFQEEHEHRVMLLIDTHASMHFGTRERFKSVQAARSAALTAWLVTRAGGRIGALAFGPCRQAQPALLGQRGALGVCAALARWDERSRDAGEHPPESLSSALQRMRPLLRGASQVVLVSDGRSVDADTQAALVAWRRHLRLSVLLVTDRLESTAPPRGRFPLAWAARRVMVDLDETRTRNDFQRALSAPAKRMETLCRSLGMACQRIDTCTDPMNAITALTGLTGRRA